MAEPEKVPEPERHPQGLDPRTPVSQIVRLEGGIEDTTVRPGNLPERFRFSKEELAAAMIGPASVIYCLEGPEDTTIRPRDPNIPLFWPKDIPLPKRPKPPETPAN